MNRRFALYLSVLSLSATLVALAELKGAPATRDDPVKGLWSRWPDRQGSGDLVRFYYFHGDGHGLYRYGKIGFTNTHGFDYRAAGDELELTFRKTGKRHRFKYAVELGRDGRRVMHVKDDPEESGVPTDYFFVPPPSSSSMAFEAEPEDAASPAGRMWIALGEYATGGIGFSLWQLGPAGIDGRGTGWHHRGDFDDWSTEAMSYRLHNERLEVRFELSGERFETGYGIATGDDDKRRLMLASDPRNWWHKSVLVDMGRALSAGARLGDMAALEHAKHARAD